MAEMVSGMTGALQGTVGGVINKGQNYLDRFFPPERRNELMAKLSKFATERPMLASFLLSQIALTGLPLGLFIVMTITVVVFSLVAALVIGILGALVFTVVCVGIALLVLLPTLFITTFAASFIWLWGVGGYYILKWFNQKEIPGIHKPLAEGMPSVDSLTGGGVSGGTQSEGGEKKEGGMNGHAEKKEHKGEKEGHQEGKSSRTDVPDPKKAADIGKVTGKTGDVTGKAGDVAGGVKGAVPGGAL